MVNKQDSYWMESSLDEIVDQKVCEYLRGHHAEYRNAKQKIMELMEQYPNVHAVFETEDAVTLTAEEHEILHTYFELEDRVEMIERGGRTGDGSLSYLLCPTSFQEAIR